MTESLGGQKSGPKKKLSTKRRVLIACAAGVVVVLAGAAWVGQTVWAGSQSATAPTASASPPAAQTTPEAEPELVPIGTNDEFRRGSDVFGSWKLSPVAEGSSLTATEEAHDGASSLLIQSAGPTGSEPAAVLSQPVSYPAGSSLDISFWAKATDAAENAIFLAESPDGNNKGFVLPGGTYDWKFFTVRYGSVAWQTNWEFQLRVEAATKNVVIDQLSVVATANGAELLTNTSFEDNSAELSVMNSSLLFTKGDVSLQLETRRPTVTTYDWVVTDGAGAEVESGTEDVSTGVSAITLDDLDYGYYGVSVTSADGDRPLERKFNIVVLEPMPEVAQADNPFGVQVHIYHEDQAKLNKTLATLADAGVGHLRFGAPWDQIEKTKGTYTYPAVLDQTMVEAERLGLSTLLYIGFTNYLYDGGKTPSTDSDIAAFAAYAKDVAAHYPDQSSEFEIYSEYNHIYNTSTCGKTPGCYKPFLEKVAAAMKSANPESKILAPNLSGMGVDFDWFSGFVDSGALSSTDVVNVHPYVQPQPPEILIESLDKMNSMVRDANGGNAKPLWLSEMGWSSAVDWVTEQQQADYLVRMAAIGLSHGVERIYWYNEVDTGPNEADIESNFGLFQSDQSFLPYTNSPKPSGAAQAVMARQIADMDVTKSEQIGESGMSVEFGEGKDLIRVLWSSAPAGTPVTVSTKKPIVLTHASGEVETLKPVDGQVKLALSSTPVYVSGDSITGVTP